MYYNGNIFSRGKTFMHQTLNFFLLVKHLILSKQKQRYQSSEQFSCAIPHYFPIFCVLVIWDTEDQSVYLGNSGRLEVCCFPLLIYVLETDKKCFYLYPALFTLGQGWSLYLFTQVCRELMLLFTVFVYAARPYLDGWDSHLLHTQSPSRKGGGDQRAAGRDCSISVLEDRKHLQQIQIVYSRNTGLC